MASQQDLKMKAKAYQNYQITTHLPAQNIRVYDEDFAKRESPSVVSCSFTALPLQTLYRSLTLRMLGGECMCAVTLTHMCWHAAASVWQRLNSEHSAFATVARQEVCACMIAL